MRVGIAFLEFRRVGVNPVRQRVCQVPIGTVENLVKLANKGKLAKIATLHVMLGKVIRKHSPDKVPSLKSVQGEGFSVNGGDDVLSTG